MDASTAEINVIFSKAKRSRVQPSQEAVMGHNIVRLLVVCPGYKKQNELIKFYLYVSVSHVITSMGY